MSRVTVRERNGWLALDIPYHGRIEPTYLSLRADEPGATRKAEEKRKQVQKAIDDSTFDWMEEFQGLSKAKMRKLGLLPAVVTKIPTLGRYAPELLGRWPARNSELTPAVHYDYTLLIKTHVLPHTIADLPMDQIRDADIRVLIKQL